MYYLITIGEQVKVKQGNGRKLYIGVINIIFDMLVRKPCNSKYSNMVISHKHTKIKIK